MGALAGSGRADLRASRPRRVRSAAASSGSCPSTACSNACAGRSGRRVADRLARALAHGGPCARSPPSRRTWSRMHRAVVTGTAPTRDGGALGRALAGRAAALAATIKRDERLSLEFSGDGPLRGVLVDAPRHGGDVRGFVRCARRTHLPPRRGKLDVGGALGRGVLCVMRVPLARRSRSTAAWLPLASGEIGADLAGYLRSSGADAWPPWASAYFVDGDGAVVAAGGLPRAGHAWRPGVRSTPSPPVSAPPRRPASVVRDGLGTADILRRVAGEDLSLLEERDVAFRCRCSRDRGRGAILAMGRAEIEGGAWCRSVSAGGDLRVLAARRAWWARRLRALLAGSAACGSSEPYGRVMISSRCPLASSAVRRRVRAVVMVRIEVRARPGGDPPSSRAPRALTRPKISRRTPRRSTRSARCRCLDLHAAGVQEVARVTPLLVATSRKARRR